MSKCTSFPLCFYVVSAIVKVSFISWDTFFRSLLYFSLSSITNNCVKIIYNLRKSLNLLSPIRVTAGQRIPFI